MVRPLAATLLVLLVSVACIAPAAPTPASTTALAARTTAPDPSATAAAAATHGATPRATRALPTGVARVIDLNGEMVWGIAAAGDTLWVEGDFVLHQLDAASGEELRSVEGYIPSVVGDTLWYQLRSGELVAADARTGEERRVYRPLAMRGTTVSDGNLWAASEGDGVLARMDLESETITGRLELPSGEPKAVVVWEGAVWVVIDGSDVVLRVDPKTMTVTDTIKAGSRPHSAAVAFGSLWVIEHGSSGVLRLSPEGDVVARIAGPGINVAITEAAGHIWASGRDTLMKIDPATNEIVDSIPIGPGEYYGMAAAKGSLWVTTGMDDKGVYQVPFR